MSNYINVAYKDKDEAKTLGAKWDNTKKSWYIPDNHENTSVLIAKFGGSVNYKIVGEKRADNALYVDLTPKNLWGKNVASLIDANVKKYIHTRANNKCEICGNKSTLIHTRYENSNNIRKLVRLMAVCGDCQLVSYYGLAKTKGLELSAKEHLKKITKMTDEACEAHIINAFENWSNMNKTEWVLDLSLLDNIQPA